MTLPGDNPGDTIGLDLGTTVLKGVRMRGPDRVVARASRRVAYRHPRPDWWEFDAEEHWRDLAGLLRELAGAAPEPVGALALSGAAGNTLLTDAGGRPLRPFIGWMDRRCAGRPPGLLRGLAVDEVRRVTGWPCLDTFPLAHLAWLCEHEPQTYRAATRICLNTDWLTFRLTGRWALDHSTATTFHLRDQVGRCWHPPFLQKLGLRSGQLSRLVDSGSAIGALTPEAAAVTGLSPSTRVAAGSFDHPAAARAVGVVNPGQLLLSCGTSWVGFMPGSDRDRLLSAGLLCDPFRSATGGPWGGMLSLPAIGPKIDEYVRRFIAPGSERPLEVFDALAAQAPPGAGGLRLDLEAPPERPEALPPSMLARALMEAAARSLAQRLDALKKHGVAFREGVLCGGPGKSPVWPGIIAEHTGIDLTVASDDAGARGAALFAARASGHPGERTPDV